MLSFPELPMTESANALPNTMSFPAPASTLTATPPTRENAASVTPRRSIRLSPVPPLIVRLYTLAAGIAENVESITPLISTCKLPPTACTMTD